MHEIKITGLTIEHRKPFPSGDKLIAEFSAEFAGLRFRGLQLVRTRRGGFNVAVPAISRSDSRSAIRFVDNSVLSGFTNAARDIYIMLGGQEHLYAGQAEADDETEDALTEDNPTVDPAD